MKSKILSVLSFLVSLILSILLCSVPSGFSREYNKIAVVVGVSDYKDNTINPATGKPYIPDLHCPANDALAIKEILEGDGWDVRLLTNSQATEYKILQAIRDAVSKLSYDDKFLFFFVGHGCVDQYGKVYISPYNSSIYTYSYDISEYELENALSSGYTNNIGIIINACHAGAFVGMEINKIEDTTHKFAYKETFDKAFFERAMETFMMDLARNGWVVIAACRGDESTWETFPWKYSWFTNHLLPTFKDISLDENLNDQISLEEAYSGLPEEDCIWIGGKRYCVHPQLYDGNGYYQDFDVTALPMAKVFLSDGTYLSYSDSLTLKGFGRPDVSLVGDFDGNGKDDVMWYESWSGNANVFLSDGTCFSYSDSLTLKGFGKPDVALIGDFDGNGKDDVMWYEKWSGNAKVFLSDGSYFNYSDSLTLKGFGMPDVALVGDFNGDGKDDLLWYEIWTTTAKVFLSDGTYFHYSDSLTLKGFGMPDLALVADFNGDGKHDLVWYEAWSSNAKVFLSSGTYLSYSDSLTLKGFGRPDVSLVGDFDGNGKDDVMWYESWSGNANVFLSDGTYFSYSDTLTLKGFGMPDMVLIGDFDGNGKDDVMWYEY